MRKPTKGPIVQKRVWQFFEALISRAEESPNFEVHWEDDNEGLKLVVKTKRRYLEELTQLKQHEIYEVINCLEELELLDDRRQKQKSGSGEWCFALKVWSRDAQRNNPHFKQVWEDSRTDNSKKLEATFVETLQEKSLQEPPPTNINWREVCETRLDNQKRLLKNPLTSNHLDFYVPLGLVEPKSKEEIRRGGDVSPEEGSRFYQLAETQITKTYNQPNEFFEQVLRQGESKTSKGRRLAIIGEPGAGKTTLCYQIAKWILEQNLGVPILIRLADIGSKPLGEFLLEDWLRDAAGNMKAAPPEYSTAFEELLESGDVWLLLDGVDEMAVASPLAAINRQLAEGWANKVCVVLTCRLNVWDADKNALRDFDVYRNLDFDENQVKEFIHQWFADNQQCEGLLRELAQSNQQRINDLVKNPLRLALLCRTWKKGSKLPDTKAGLYKRFVEAFYTLKDEFAIEQAQQQQLTQALGELAKRAIDGEDKDAKTGEVISRFRLRQCLVDRVFKDRSDLLEWALKLGWLNRVGLASVEEEDSDRAVYAFFHPTFQEYFAALAVDDWHFFLNHVPHNPDGGNYRIFEPHWKQVILLWLGRSDVEKQQKEQFIQELIQFEDTCGDYFYKDLDKGFYEYRAYFLAAAAIAEFKDCSKADEIVAQIVESGFGYFHIEKWSTFRDRIEDPIEEGASSALLQTNYGIAVNKLIDLLETTEDEYMWLRSRAYIFGYIWWRATETLGKIDPGNASAIAALVRILETTEDDGTRRIAVDCLGKIGTGNASAIAALVRILETTEDDSTRWRAAESLGQIDPGNQEAIAALVRMLETTEDDSARMRAAESLGKIGTGNEAAIAALVRILETTENDDTRRSAADDLGKIGTGNASAIAALVRILETTENDDTRRSAVDSLREIDPGNASAIAALVRILETTENEETRWRAAYCLGQIDPGNASAIAALVRILETTEDDINRSMVVSICLGEIGTGNASAIAALVRILETTEDDINRSMAASYCLGEIDPGNASAIAALVRILETTEDDDTRRIAVDCLGEIDPGNEVAIAALVRILSTTENDDTRWRAVDCLGEIDPGNASAISALVRILSTTENDSTRWSAAYRLGEIGTGNEVAISALVRILSTTENDSTRWTAAESLRKIGTGNEVAIAALVRILKTTENDSIRRSAAESLGKIDPGNKDAIAALVRILSTTENGYTRRLAADSLRKIVQNQQMPSVVSELRRCLTDEVYKTNFDLYKNCYEVIWRCAEEMPYPKFYQAWHGSSIASHPEVPQTTGVGFTFSILSLNLGELPELLRAAIDSNSELTGKVQLICIDASKFENPDNPALEIYAEMVTQGCPERQNGEPETMQALKVYSQLKCQGVFLIFYQSTTSELSQEFSPILLKSLSKFNNATRICIVSDQPDILLQFFSPNQPDLVEDVVAWMHRVVLES